MKILLTGSSGFLGSIIHNTLSATHHLISISRANNADIVADITKFIPQLPAADMVVHSAGYAHSIPKNRAAIDNLFNVNVDGTKNLLRALEKLDQLPTTIVFISSVAVYGISKGEDIQENQVLRPKTPYAISKHQAENLIINWCQERSVNATILRLPLIIGQQPKGNLAALFKAIKNGWYCEINQNTANKSAVLALDVANLIPYLNQRAGIYNLSDGLHPSMNEIAQAIAMQLSRKIYWKVPISFLEHASLLGDYLERLNITFPINSRRLSIMTNQLTFSDKKARQELNWNPTSVIEWLKSNPL